MVYNNYMDQLFIQPIDGYALSRFEGLLRSSTSGLLFGSTVFSTSPSQIQAWQILRRDEPIAVITVTNGGQGVGYVNLAVKQEARRQGVGTQALAALFDEPAIKHFRYLRSAVESGNIGAQKLLTKNGFTRKGHNAQGYLEFEKRII